MKYKQYITEIESPKSYPFDMTQSGQNYLFVIHTDDIEFGLSLKRKSDFYVSELGYMNRAGTGIKPFDGNIDNVDMMYNTMVDIFTKFHLEGNEGNFIVYKFPSHADKAFVLLMITLFKTYLKNYYDLNPDLNDLSNVNHVNRLIVQTTLGKGQYVDDYKLKQLKSA